MTANDKRCLIVLLHKKNIYNRVITEPGILMLQCAISYLYSKYYGIPNILNLFRCCAVIKWPIKQKSQKPKDIKIM